MSLVFSKCPMTLSLGWTCNLIFDEDNMLVCFLFFIQVMQYLANLSRLLILGLLKLKGELRPEIFLLHMKVLTLIKAKSNVFLWYVQCCSCTRRSKNKILTTRAPPSWIELKLKMRRQNPKCFRLCNAIWIDYLRLSNDFSGFYKR